MKRNTSSFPTVLALAPLIALALVAGAMLLNPAGRADAETEGDCEALIAGTNVAGLDSTDASDAITVEEDANIPVAFTSEAGFESHSIQIVFVEGLPGATVVDDLDDASPQFHDTVTVGDYAWAGVGFYKIEGEAELADGSTCRGAALVDVQGAPVTTIAGTVAMASIILGGAAGLVSAVAGAVGGSGPLAPYSQLLSELGRVNEAQREQAARERARREAERRQQEGGLLAKFLSFFDILGCLTVLPIALIVLPFMAISGGAGNEPTAQPEPSQPAGEASTDPRHLPRAPWRPRITLIGLGGGLLAGAGVVGLIQQYAISYPTISLVLTWLAIGVVVCGILLPTIGCTVGWLRINLRLRGMERAFGWE